MSQRTNSRAHEHANEESARRPGRSPASAEIAVADCRSYEESAVRTALRDALDRLGGLERWVRPGQTVFIKPNMLAAKRPERAVTTHPAVVEEVVSEVRRLGARPVIGDSPAGVLDSIQKFWEETGYADVARRTGAELVKLDGGPVTPRQVRGRTYYISSAVAQADVTISLPKLKTHSLTVLTGAVKNTFGTIPGFRKGEYHKEAPKPLPFAEIIADVYEAVRPTLTVMDAVVALEGDGPSVKGSPRELGLLFVGEDAVALDAAAARVVGLAEAQCPVTAAALRRRLGVGLSHSTVHGVSLEERIVSDFRLASNRLIHLTPTWAVKLLGRYIWVRPYVLGNSCTACGLCVEACPVDAMKPDASGVPAPDYSRCIECLACHECCPSEAIEQRVSWLARRLT